MPRWVNGSGRPILKGHNTVTMVSRQPTAVELDFLGGGSPWRPGQVEQLHDLIVADASPQQAAAILGKTRNQVTSLAARRGWRFQSSEHVLPHATAKLREDLGLIPRTRITLRKFSWEQGA